MRISTTQIVGPPAAVDIGTLADVLAELLPQAGAHAIGFNYVVRSVGYSLGSAIGGLILAAGTGPGHLFPDDGAYTTAALVGIGSMAITALTSLALARRRSSETNP
jgi:predicted MFS family arabinose efflux permease